MRVGIYQQTHKYKELLKYYKWLNANKLNNLGKTKIDKFLKIGQSLKFNKKEK